MTFSFKILIPSLNSKIEKDMKVIVFIFLIVITNVCKAQAPWRAKLFVHFLDSNNQIVTDTVWFGCDSLGDDGLQSELDILDTTLRWNSVYGSDDIVRSHLNTDCGNLKLNTKAFKKKYTTFSFYVTGKPISISWDTTDFIYQNDSQYRLSGIVIRSSSGYINSIDGQLYILGGDLYSLINNNYIYRGFVFKNDSISIYPISKPNECTNDSYSFDFTVEIYLGWYEFTGTKDWRIMDQISIYPNPTTDVLNLEFETPFTGNLILHNQIGQTLKFIALNNTQLIKINLSEYDNGLYYLSYQNNKNQIFNAQKIIIQH
jgi:hypothetical protein